MWNYEPLMQAIRRLRYDDAGNPRPDGKARVYGMLYGATHGMSASSYARYLREPPHVGQIPRTPRRDLPLHNIPTRKRP